MGWWVVVIGKIRDQLWLRFSLALAKPNNFYRIGISWKPQQELVTIVLRRDHPNLPRVGYSSGFFFLQWITKVESFYQTISFDTNWFSIQCNLCYCVISIQCYLCYCVISNKLNLLQLTFLHFDQEHDEPKKFKCFGVQLGLLWILQQF